MTTKSVKDARIHVHANGFNSEKLFFTYRLLNIVQDVMIGLCRFSHFSVCIFLHVCFLSHSVVKVRGARGAQPPAPISAPCNSMSTLIESIKCYFMPK